MRSYDYAHRQGVRTISWEEFATLTDQLAEALEQAGVEVIVVVLQIIREECDGREVSLLTQLRQPLQTSWR